MKQAEVKNVIDKIIGQVLGYKNPLTTDQALQKFAFDVKLPQKVTDASTAQDTWTGTVNPTKYISYNNVLAKADTWMMPKREVNSLEDILAAWNLVNYQSTERHLDSLNISESDNVVGSENVHRSYDIHNSKNIIFSDGIFNSEFIVAGQRSNNVSYCIRIDDSINCSNSFSVNWSKKIVNSLFIQDSADLYECIFCCHITNKKFCIANMQFEEAEYRKIKDMVVRWILTSN